MFILLPADGGTYGLRSGQFNTYIDRGDRLTSEKLADLWWRRLSARIQVLLGPIRKLYESRPLFQQWIFDDGTPAMQSVAGPSRIRVLQMA